MDLDFNLPSVSLVSIKPELNLAWKRVDDEPDAGDEDPEDDSDDERRAGYTTVDWGKTPEAKRWEGVNRPYHPGDGRRGR